MPHPWNPPTRLDEVRAAGEVRAGENPTVTCACGRRVAADMLVDVRALPSQARAVLPHTATHACDGCTSRIQRVAGMSRAEFAQLLGAPADHVAALAAREHPTRL